MADVSPVFHYPVSFQVQNQEAVEFKHVSVRVSVHIICGLCVYEHYDIVEKCVWCSVLKPRKFPCRTIKYILSDLILWKWRWVQQLFAIQNTSEQLLKEGKLPSIA